MPLRGFRTKLIGALSATILGLFSMQAVAQGALSECNFPDNDYYTYGNFARFVGMAQSALGPVSDCRINVAACNTAFQHFYNADRIFTAIGQRSITDRCLRCSADVLLVYAEIIQQLAITFSEKNYHLGGSYSGYPQLVADHSGKPSCSRGVVGNWNWPVGTVRLSGGPNGGSANATGNPHVNSGTWRYIGRNQIEILWDTGYRDTLTLTGDTLSGSNQHGNTFGAQRLR